MSLLMDPLPRRQIAIYGKGGIGKSTTASNLSICWAEMGEIVMQIGCSPKGDSTSFLRGGVVSDVTVLDQLRQYRGKVTKELIQSTIVRGDHDILCMECGGPLPGTGCAGRGVLSALDALTELQLLEEYGVTLVVYDVIGDVVCGGFAQPIRAGYAREIYIVTSGELMSLYAANNICLAVKSAIEEGKSSIRIGGLINNMRNIEREEELVAEFSRRLEVPIVAYIPRSELMQRAESRGMTLLKAFPDSPEAIAFRRLAAKIKAEPAHIIPSPLTLDELLVMYKGEELVGTDRPRVGKKVPPPTRAPIGIEDETRARPLIEPQNCRTIALYGKGGIGKSTTASNVSAALSQMGERVLQIGCDPKHDSISTLCGRLMPAILDELRDKGILQPEHLLNFVYQGYNGVLGMECGGPAPGKGCAGRGVNIALQLLHEAELTKRLGITFIIYDVLGDVVCGGFATPVKSGYVREVYVVTCGELLTLHMVNNILISIYNLNQQGAECRVAGIINNQRGLKNERDIVEAYAELVGVPVIKHLPRSATVQRAEMLTKTVIEAYPQSEMADEYRALADKMLKNSEGFLPRVVSLAQIRQVVDRYGA